MYISKETPKETDLRLKKVLKKSRFKVFEKSYYFNEIPVEKFEFNEKALAFVRDNDVWSQLIPVDKKGNEEFRIFSFHFEKDLDNSGFVGWLATKIKDDLGSDVFVVCGQNSNQGGIFDYWGCPIEVSDEVIIYIKNLMN
ncbi:DUF6196 family protein [Christiangramia sp. SM2212]|uniref:DUF6196 family protein n=1 Tax=Christiangramia sediminicola TaxID=3073267 RepID=A0ABU1EKW9_9FLAO|nr:DUF6196 family protein [Christiangramia sp. SM2212]MDR5589024.1 DUF6196 family protein [Christiangramia sp. SM2212]